MVVLMMREGRREGQLLCCGPTRAAMEVEDLAEVGSPSPLLLAPNLGPVGVPRSHMGGPVESWGKEEEGAWLGAAQQGWGGGLEAS